MGAKEGRGIYYFSEGSIYDGEWEEDKKTNGHLKLHNGDEFWG